MSKFDYRPLLIALHENQSDRLDGVAAGGILNTLSPWTPDDKLWHVAQAALGNDIGQAYLLIQMVLPTATVRTFYDPSNLLPYLAYVANKGHSSFHIRRKSLGMALVLALLEFLED